MTTMEAKMKIAIGDLMIVRYLGSIVTSARVAQAGAKYIELDDGSRWCHDGSPYPRQMHADASIQPATSAHVDELYRLDLMRTVRCAISELLRGLDRYNSDQLSATLEGIANLMQQEKMMTTQAETTMRQAMMTEADIESGAALTLAHARGYHSLYAQRDGSVRWLEAVSSDEQLIDDRADGPSITALPLIIQVGAGSCGCECGHCEYAYDDLEHHDHLQDAMRAAVSAIPHGFFADESD